MTPLDLTKTPPRSPRNKLGGLCMLPRMIDIARAKLPGGRSGDYRIGRGMSALVLANLGISASEFVELVGKAATIRNWRIASVRPKSERSGEF